MPRERANPRRSGHLLAAALWVAGLVALPSASFCQPTRATETPIDGPASLAISNDRYLFVASFYENNVRRIDLQSGTAETVAGNGKECCYREYRKAKDVSLDDVSSLAVNSLGDIFISEYERVLKVDAQTGLIATVAGGGTTANTADGLPALSTSFRQIWGLALDRDDNLFISDRWRGAIFRLDRTGRIFRFAGDGTRGFRGDGGPALSASFKSVGSIAFDSRGNLLIADEGNCRLRRVDHDTGIIQTVFATEPIAACAADENGSWAAPAPTDLVAEPGGSIVFLETVLDVVRRFDVESNTLSEIAGNGTRGFAGDRGPASQAMLSGPSGLAIRSNGDLFISDTRNNRVRRVDARTKMIQTVVGNGLPTNIHSEE